MPLCPRKNPRSGPQGPGMLPGARLCRPHTGSRSCHVGSKGEQGMLNRLAAAGVPQAGMVTGGTLEVKSL